MIHKHLSIVIPFYNPPYEAFQAYLQSVYKLDPLEMILVDDCSNDEKVITLAKRSGRTSPSQTLKHLLACHTLTPKKIKLYAVNYGQNLEPLKSFAKEQNIPLVIQRIQPKKSYQAHYSTEPLPYTTYQCPYLENEKMRYYFVDGTKAPCCFMIDSTKVLHAKVIQHHLAQKSVPSCCTQCGELTGVKRLYM
ncbi:hypothetical protein SJPD1_2117 [Sulfurospirillum diekertiae]|uniref:Glycosyltransferase n=1 Tax=Sulfurospirillum diekertiae TaxID=1854492 RepID=A0A290HWL1_9BACT|nr:glycosyltransferase [Sulfurospirillum diekertiae]ATB70216.1 hypothetical protein SJPD1_2117 [Sulfurospirillum diekertiae]